MNKEILEQVDELESDGMAVTKQWYEYWSEGMRYFFSDQDDKLDPAKDWDRFVLNYIWPCAMQEIAKLAKNYPKILALPVDSEDETDVEAAEVWQGATQWQWQNNLRMRRAQIAGGLITKIFGYKVSYVYWEPMCNPDRRTREFLGDVRHKLWNPAFFWADGDEDINDGNCGTVRWADLEYARWRWPQFADKLESIAVSVPEAGAGDQASVSLRSWMSSGTLYQSEDIRSSGAKKRDLASIVSLISRDFTGGGHGLRAKKYVRLSNTFLKNYESDYQRQEENVPPEELISNGTVYQAPDQRLIDRATGQPYAPLEWPKRLVGERRQYKYPFGRQVVSAGDGDSRIGLSDGECETSRWPFVVTPHYMLPFMWQGLNAVSLYKGVQDMINVSTAHLINHLKMYGDPVIAIEKDALAVDKNGKPFPILSKAGSLLRLVKGGLSKYRRESPAPLSPAILAVYQLFVQEFKNLTGLQSIARGEQLRGGTTATETQVLAISSADRIYLQSVFEDEWCTECAKLIAELMQNNYDLGRWVKIVGEGKVRGSTQISDKLKSVQYDITVMPGTTLPFDEEKQIAKHKLAYEMLANPVANPLLPEMLRILGISNREKLLKEYPAYQKYRQFVQLYIAVVKGEIPVEQAVQALFAAAVQEYQRGQ